MEANNFSKLTTPLSRVYFAFAFAAVAVFTIFTVGNICADAYAETSDGNDITYSKSSTSYLSDESGQNVQIIKNNKVINISKTGDGKKISITNNSDNDGGGNAGNVAGNGSGNGGNGAGNGGNGAGNAGMNASTNGSAGGSADVGSDFKSTWRNTSKTVLSRNKFIARHTKGSVLNLDVGLGGGAVFNGDVWATASSIPSYGSVTNTTPLTNSTVGNAFITLGVTRWGKEDALYLSTLVSLGFGVMNASDALSVGASEAYKQTFISGNFGINQRIGYTVDLSSNITVTPYFALGGGICAGDYCSDYGGNYNNLSSSLQGTITGYLSQALGMLLAYHTQKGQYIGLFTQIGLTEIWQTATYADTLTYPVNQKSGSDFLTALSVNAGLQVGF